MANDEEYEFVEYGEIAWYDERRGDPPVAKRWIWSGPDVEFTRSLDERGHMAGEPYKFQYPLIDAQPVYIKVPKKENQNERHETEDGSTAAE